MTRQEDFEFTSESGDSYILRLTVDMERLAKLLGPRARKSKRGISSIARAGVVAHVLAGSASAKAGQS
jgi:hypothetical protein